MLYDPIQGQGEGHGGPKVVKMADFKVCLHRYACNQKSVRFAVKNQARFAKPNSGTILRCA